ncbi:COG3650 family protein [Paracoccus spongiarum]|uniref:Uncharacterized protein n=1 Tax=Paracoccus spongiarum TaxID=3064387 RepID=A0ABT9JDR0_9RHOB|nr:hypothetical protein [Paracoccus sp. 2205BS29-5]MDP5307953.1 hypothetical protein [Paracoccus sp. 2205BS29-5]
MSTRLALIALLTLPLAACQGVSLPGLGGTDEAPAAQGHKGPPGVSPLEQPIETGAAAPRAVATAEATTMNTAAFSARGNEPFWSVDVAGSTAIYKTPENQKGRAVRVNRLTFAEGVEYVGVLNGRPFALTVRSRQCQDSMAGEKFPMTATLIVSGRSNAGCARPATAEVAAAVAAVKAPAPAEPRARAAAPKPAAPSPARAAPAPAATTPAPTTSSPAPASSTPATPAPAATAPATPAPSSTAPSTPAPSTTAPSTAAPATTLPAPAMTLPTTPPVLPPAPAASTTTPEAATDGN